MNITVATWIFGTASFLFIIGVFLFSPHELPPYKIRILAIVSAILLGFFGFFFSGTLTLGVSGDWSHVGKVSIRASSGVALFLITMFWWKSQFAPVKARNEMPPDLTQAIETLAYNNLPLYKINDTVKRELLGHAGESFPGMYAMGSVTKAKESYDLTNYQKCLDYSNDALKSEPTFPYANFLRGLAQVQLGNYELAVDDLTVVIEKFPNIGPPYVGRMDAYVKLLKFEEAIKDARKLCEMGDCRYIRLLERLPNRK